MSLTPPILSLIKRGNDKFPRYLIAKGDPIRNPVYWDSDNSVWSEDESKATVYANITQALWDHHDLMMESLEGQPCHRYVAPMYIELYGKKPDLPQLRDWLEKAVRIVMNSPQYNNGPEGSFGVLIADFERTEEAK